MIVYVIWQTIWDGSVRKRCVGVTGVVDVQNLEENEDQPWDCGYLVWDKHNRGPSGQGFRWWTFVRPNNARGSKPKAVSKLSTRHSWGVKPVIFGYTFWLLPLWSAHLTILLSWLLAELAADQNLAEAKSGSHNPNILWTTRWSHSIWCFPQQISLDVWGFEKCIMWFSLQT